MFDLAKGGQASQVSSLYIGVVRDPMQADEMFGQGPTVGGLPHQVRGATGDRSIRPTGVEGICSLAPGARKMYLRCGQVCVGRNRSHLVAGLATALWNASVVSSVYASLARDRQPGLRVGGWLWLTSSG